MSGNNIADMLLEKQLLENAGLDFNTATFIAASRNNNSGNNDNSDMLRIMALSGQMGGNNDSALMTAGLLASGADPAMVLLLSQQQNNHHQQNNHQRHHRDPRHIAETGRQLFCAGYDQRTFTTQAPMMQQGQYQQNAHLMQQAQYQQSTPMLTPQYGVYAAQPGYYQQPGISSGQPNPYTQNAPAQYPTTMPMAQDQFSIPTNNATQMPRTRKYGYIS